MSNKISSRTIRDHHVYGKTILVIASSEDEAYTIAKRQTGMQIWEIKKKRNNSWEVFVADPQDCFATND